MTGVLATILLVVALSPVFLYLSTSTVYTLSAISAVSFAFSWRKSRRKWRPHVGGHVEPGFEKVATVYRELVEAGVEQGSAFAAWHEGRAVVDLWGGYADFDALRFRKEDSRSMFYSATKAMTAVVMAMLVDRGHLDYEKPISYYWPEFGQGGKEDIKVKTILCHQSGLIHIKQAHRLALMRDDPKKLADLLASQSPMWKPGAAQGYHVLTYALYADQLVQRTDPRRRTLGDFFQQEIAEPFGIDFHIGEPRELFHRACREGRANFGLKFFFTTTLPTGMVFMSRFVYSLFAYRDFYLRFYIGNPTDWRPRRLNDPEYRELQCGASHGFGTARAAAKLMGILGNGGKWQGKQLLSEAAIEKLNTPLSSHFDRVVLRPITYGPGTIISNVKDPTGKSRRCFGHWGAGGQMMYCDPARRAGWSYVTNFSNILHGFIIDHRYTALQSALEECLHARGIDTQ